MAVRCNHLAQSPPYLSARFVRSLSYTGHTRGCPVSRKDTCQPLFRDPLTTLVFRQTCIYRYPYYYCYYITRKHVVSALVAAVYAQTSQPGLRVSPSTCLFFSPVTHAPYCLPGSGRPCGNRSIIFCSSVPGPLSKEHNVRLGRHVDRKRRVSWRCPQLAFVPGLARKPLFTLEPCLWVRPRAARRRDKRFELEPRRHRSSGTTRLAGWCFLPPKTPRSRDKPPPHHVLSPILSSTSMKQPIEGFPYSIAIRPIPRRHGRWEIPSPDMHILQISMVKAPTKQNDGARWPNVTPPSSATPRCYFVSWCLGYFSC